jgi:hypothetical protein
MLGVCPKRHLTAIKLFPKNPPRPGPGVRAYTCALPINTYCPRGRGGACGAPATLTDRSVQAFLKTVTLAVETVHA